jgi:hypothetical protein
VEVGGMRQMDDGGSAAACEPAPDSHTASVPGPPPASYAELGCSVNSVDPADLLRGYERTRFLYPAKRERVAAFLPEILDNWRRGMAGGDSVLGVVTHGEPDSAWASLSGWRTVYKGWHHQHVVSTGGRGGSRAVVLSEQAMKIRHRACDSIQAWFQPSNRYSRAMFGPIAAVAGPDRSAVTDFQYLAVPLRAPSEAPGVTVVPCVDGAGSGLLDLAVRARGRVYATAEELDQEDLLLDRLDDVYRAVGLRRYRRIWLAMMDGHDAPVGAAIAYRGPLGFNLSFLENRCEVLLDPALTGDRAGSVARALVGMAAPAYADFRPGWMPLVVDAFLAPRRLGEGVRPLRRYAQAVWLRAGFLAAYRHMERRYQRPAK